MREWRNPETMRRKTRVLRNMDTPGTEMNGTAPAKREHSPPGSGQHDGVNGAGKGWKTALAGIMLGIAIAGATAGIVLGISIASTTYTAKRFSGDEAHQSVVQREHANEERTQTVRRETASEREVDSQRSEGQTSVAATKAQARVIEARMFEAITKAMGVVIGISGAVVLFSWFHLRRRETMAKRQAVEVDDQSSRKRGPEKLEGLRESINRLEKLIDRSFLENELGGHRYHACAREAMAQGESIADRIRMLELATDTHREKAQANEELEALQEQVEKVSRAIATSGLGTPTSETSLTETMHTLETMESRASRYTETTSQPGEQ